MQGSERQPRQQPWTGSRPRGGTEEGQEALGPEVAQVGGSAGRLGRGAFLSPGVSAGDGAGSTPGLDALGEDLKCCGPQQVLITPGPGLTQPHIPRGQHTPCGLEAEVVDGDHVRRNLGMAQNSPRECPRPWPHRIP